MYLALSMTSHLILIADGIYDYNCRHCRSDLITTFLIATLGEFITIIREEDESTTSFKTSIYFLTIKTQVIVSKVTSGLH